MRFTVIRAPSPYNVILGRSGLKTLQAVPSTIHAMMKFLTPRGIATLVTRSTAVSECKKLEDKQAMCDEEIEAGENSPPEEIMVNPAYPDQLVTIGGSLTKECQDTQKLTRPLDRLKGNAPVTNTLKTVN
ncbi:reverse transcriptase domain-containing protein [Artemisia annua]|uniref:Reverse transcriptase domain-containing protein n=1 Tax=Artemisia annua TaxID=35608 RepID=A0A2U1P7K2_ARTAN|nr:reverse transcriptase domain-containing protein [Artemisia annua]